MQFLVQQLQRKIPQELQHVFDWIIRLLSSWLVKSPEGFVKSYFTSELIESNLVSPKEPNTSNRRNICTNFERNFYFLKIENSKILTCPYITIRSIYRSGKFRHAPRFIIFQKGLSELQEFFSTTWPFIIMNITLMLFCSFFLCRFLCVKSLLYRIKASWESPLSEVLQNNFSSVKKCSLFHLTDEKFTSKGSLESLKPGLGNLRMSDDGEEKEGSGEGSGEPEGSGAGKPPPFKETIEDLVESVRW